jgi:hypothetical protein
MCCRLACGLTPSQLGSSWLVAEERILDHQPDDIDAEAIDALVQPEAHGVEHGGQHLWVAIVQFRLLFDELMQVILPVSVRRRSRPGRQRSSASCWAGRRRAPGRARCTSRAWGCRGCCGSPRTRRVRRRCGWAPGRGSSFMPRACTAASSRSKSASVPKIGWMPRSRPRHSRSRAWATGRWARASQTPTQAFAGSPAAAGCRADRRRRRRCCPERNARVNLVDDAGLPPAERCGHKICPFFNRIA